MTAVQTPGRYGALVLDEEKITMFQEKPIGDGGWINGGYFVLEPKVFDYIDNDFITWEKEPLEALAQGKKLNAYKHTGFWQAMDTLRDKVRLEEYWQTGNAPWKIW